MGYYSIVLIQNDFLHEIEEDPRFGEKVSSAISQHFVEPGRAGQRFRVLAVDHADVQQTIVVGGYQGIVLGTDNTGGVLPKEDDPHTIERWLKKLADKFGYRLSNKPAKAVSHRRRW